MKVYALSGLGADQRIFNYLSIDAELVPIKWIDPEPNELLQSYAHRLADQIDTTNPFALIGVSFGGMLATEIANKYNPEFTLLVSSASGHKELPLLAKVARRWNLVKKIPLRLFKPPQFVAWFGFPFHKGRRRVAQGIIEDMDPAFVKWALGAIVHWTNVKRPDNFTHIHGRWDPILPLRRNMDAMVLGSGHFIILKNAEEISQILNELNVQTG